MKPDSRINKFGLWLMEISGFYLSDQEKVLRKDVQTRKDELQLIKDEQNRLENLKSSYFKKLK